MLKEVEACGSTREILLPRGAAHQIVFLTSAVVVEGSCRPLCEVTSNQCTFFISSAIGLLMSALVPA